MSWEPTSEGFGEAQAAHTAPAVSEEQQRAAYRDYQWASNRARYEYNENAVDENGMAPRNESLEKELFDNEQQGAIDFSKYEKIPVKVERGTAPPPIRNFDEADLHPVMKENVRLARYTNPTPVQTYSIPIVTNGKDLMACAQTGSGKTAAFLVPTLSALFGRAKELAKPRPAPYETRSYKAEPLVLIIAPTRELCSQIFDECRKFTYRSSLRPCAVYGGADTLGQLRQLERGCDVLAAAPGRLMDFIDRGKIGLGRVKYLVLDEADRMLDMGFESIIRAIVQKKGMNPEHQTLLYSATFPRAIRALARDFLRADYLFLKVGRVGGTSTSITQRIIYVPEDQKREELRNLLNGLPPSRTLIFVETKRSADSLDQFLYERNFPSTSIHGDRTQMEREDALLAFKSGKCPLLVATAVAARGIDIRNVMHVVNYDMPNDMDEYIHRIGRTARVGKTGLATSFYNERSEHLASDLTKLLKECQQEIPDFLQSYVTDDMTFDEDLDDTQVEAPTYAGREYVPMERNVPGAPQGFNNAEGTGAADSAWAEDSYGGGGNNGARAGDWNCSACSASNYARRTECFKCNEPRPEGAGGGFGGERRPPRARRDGDWDCSGCGAVNFASRNECFKCQAPKQDGDGGFGEYNGDSNYGNYNQPADTGASTFDSANWDSSAAAAGWGESGDNNAPAASGGWGEPAPAAPAAAPATSGGWGEPAPAATPAAAPATSGGWGEPTPAATPAAAPVTSGGWGEPAPAAPAAAPATSGGWGEPTPAAAPATSGGWGEPAPAAAPAASGGWNAPAAAAAPAPAPAAAPAPAPAAAPAPTPAPVPASAPANDGWGSTPAQSSGDGWGSAPAQTSGDGWGSAPAQTNGFGW